MSEVNIQVQETVENVEIVANNNVIEVNITRQSGGGGGAVDSVNGQTGVVVLNADDITETSTRFWLTNALKTAYDSAVTWISTNGTNLLNHVASTSNPHNVTAAQVGAPSGSGTSTGINTGDQDLSGLQDKRIVVSTNTTAVIDGAYTLVASSTFTDPTPSEGKGYSVFIRNGTATIGAVSYSTVGTLVWRLFHSGSWATYVLTNQTQLNAKEDSITAGTTSQYYRGDKTFQTLNVSAVSGLQTALDLKADRFFNVKVPTTSYLTGTLAESEIYRLEITGNTFSATDILKIHRLVCQKVNANATFTIRVKLSTSTTMPSGTTDQVALLTSANANQAYAPITRTFFITGGNIIGFPFTVNSVIDNSFATGVNSTTFDRTLTHYLYVSITLGNVNDQVRLVGGQISNV